MSRPNQIAAKRLDQAHLECRLMYNHPFELVDPSELSISSKFTGKHKQGFRCPRCGTERLDVWNWLGELMHRRYHYPEGYHIPSTERPTAKDLRKEFMRRLK